MKSETYYDVLGVEETATQDEIKKAYRKLAKENHPDKGGDEETFKKISVAYDTIGNEEGRTAYDNERKNPFSRYNGGYAQHFRDIYNETFNQRRTHSTTIVTNIGVVESYLGGKKTINYQRKTSCGGCSGTGGDKSRCTRCGGNGFVIRQFGNGMFTQVIQTQCDSCFGQGEIITNPCNTCGGSGTKDEVKTVEIKLPHGVDGGQFLRLQGQGDFKNGVFGDLIIRVQVEPEGGFDKVGNTLIYNAYFNIDEIQNDTLIIPHPDGQLTLKLPKNIDTSKPLRIKGKGFKLGENGDMLINQFLKFERT